MAPAKPKPKFAADKIERRKIADLKPWPRNPRTHAPEQIEAIAAMIREYGFTEPLLVDEKNFILAGHGRTAAASKVGFDELPVVVLRGLSEAQKRALVIADNRASEMAGWDKDLLKLELGELKRIDFDLSLTGFTADALVSYLAETSGPTPPAQFAAVGEDLPTEHECPKCGYRWSGSSAPKLPEEAPRPRRRRVT